MKLLDARALCAFAWANTFGLAWALLLDIVPWDKFSVPMFILFFLIAVGAAVAASGKEG